MFVPKATAPPLCGHKPDVWRGLPAGRPHRLPRTALRRPRSLNAQDASGLNALHVACWRRQHRLVGALLRHGADPTLLTQDVLSRERLDTDDTRSINGGEADSDAVLRRALFNYHGSELMKWANSTEALLPWPKVSWLDPKVSLLWLLLWFPTVLQAQLPRP